MPTEKDIIEKFDKTFILPSPLVLTSIDFIRYKELMKQFLLTELQALKEELMGEEQEYVGYNETWGDTERNSNDVRTGINHHRQHTKEVFNNFGIK